MTQDITYKIAEDGRNYRFNYRVAAIVEARGKILIHKFIEADYCFLPGGRVKIGETAQDAIVRELKEELGIDAVVSGLPFLVENFFPYADEHFHEICLFFKIDGNGLQLPADHDIRDKVQFLWRDGQTVADLNLQPAFLRDALHSIPATTRHIVHDAGR